MTKKNYVLSTGEADGHIGTFLDVKLHDIPTFIERVKQALSEHYDVGEEAVELPATIELVTWNAGSEDLPYSIDGLKYMGELAQTFLY